MRITRPLQIPLVFLFVLVCLISHDILFRRAQAKASTAAVSQADPIPPLSHEIDFAYYSLREGYNSTLFLVSDSPQAIDLTLAVHGRRGETVSTPMTIPPQQKLPVELRELLTRLGADVEGAFDEGSVAVSYRASGARPVVGQVTITNPALSLVHESPMFVNDPGHSEIPPLLHSLWWGLEAGRDVQFMVSNTGGEAITADLSLDFAGAQHAGAPLAFTPHETKVISIRELLGEMHVNPSQAPEGGLTIMQRGSNPALIASGRMTDPSTGFSTTLNFLLPAKQKVSALHASGLPIATPSADSPFANAGRFTPHVVVRNLLGTPQSIAITLEYPSPHGAGQAALSPFTLAGYTTKDISLEAFFGLLPLPLPFASVRIQYSGPPGSAIAEVSSVEEKGSLVIDSRLANEADSWAGSGTNPWHLDAKTDSIVFLTNMGDQPSRIGFQVVAGGVPYSLSDVKLDPHETRAINLRELRDTQKADFQGNQIPADATDGSVWWMRLDDVPVMGRVLVLDRETGLASNYDCCPCCCPGNFSSVSVSPVDPSMLVGTTTQFGATEHRIDCNSVDCPSDITSLATWSSSDTTVCTVNSTTSPGLVTAVAGGSTSITATFTDTTFPLAPSCFCSPVQRVSQTGSSTPTVRPTVSVSCGPLDLSFRPDSAFNDHDCRLQHDRVASRWHLFLERQHKQSDSERRGWSNSKGNGRKPERQHGRYRRQRDIYGQLAERHSTIVKHHRAPADQPRTEFRLDKSLGSEL